MATPEGQSAVALPHVTQEAANRSYLCEVRRAQRVGSLRGNQEHLSGLSQQRAGRAGQETSGQRCASEMCSMQGNQAKPRVRQQVLVSSVFNAVLPRARGEEASSGSGKSRAAASISAREVLVADLRHHDRAVRGDARRPGRDLCHLSGDQRCLGSGKPLCGPQPHHWRAPSTVVCEVQSVGAGPGRRPGVCRASLGVRQEACRLIDQAESDEPGVSLMEALRRIKYGVSV